MSAPSRIAVLDGVRGLAIAFILVFHGLSLFQPMSAVGDALKFMTRFGWVGVDLFFVLSGFLITGILLKASRENYFKNFYMRRTLRIFPIYYLFLAFFFLLLPLVVNVHADPWFSNLFHLQAPYWAYLQNWMMYETARVSGAWPGSSYLDHFWSLAIEEQFYIVWPLIVFVFARRSLTKLCVGLIAAAVAVRIYLLAEGVSTLSIYVNTFARMDALVVGALLCLLRESHLQQLVAWRKALVGLGAACAALLAYISFAMAGPDAVTAMQTIGYTALAVLFALTIHFALQSGSGPLRAAFESRLLVTLGKYSYALYIVHWPIFYFLYTHANFYVAATRTYGELGGVAVTLAAGFGASFIIAWLSWRYVEGPLLRLRDRIEWRPAPLPAQPPTSS